LSDRESNKRLGNRLPRLTGRCNRGVTVNRLLQRVQKLGQPLPAPQPPSLAEVKPDEELDRLAEA
jgi:hypothetical protein